MKWLVKIVFVLLLVGCAQEKPKPEKTCGFLHDADGQRLSWSSGLPIPIFVHESYPEAARISLEKAIKIWDEGFGQKVFVLENGVVGGANHPQRDQKSVIYWMTAWEPGKETEQGRTDVVSEGDEILEADVRINGASNKFSLYFDQPEGRDGEVSLTSLLVHELGHVLGLAHNEQPSSVMKTYLAPLEERRKIKAIDVTNLTCEYH